MLRHSAVFMFAIAMALPAAGQDVRITEDKTSSSFTVNGESFEIARIQDQDNHLSGDFAKTSRACPPFCIQPVSAGTGVETVGELDVITYLENDVVAQTGLLIDARLPEFYAQGAIPGAVNLPFAALAADNPYRNDILRALGAVDAGGSLDFSAALDLTLYCNGPWSDQAPRAVTNLLDAGYPADKIHYYRGGMQDWTILGLTVFVPSN